MFLFSILKRYSSEIGRRRPMTESHEAKQVDRGAEPGESCVPLAGAAAEAGGSTGDTIPEATPIPIPIVGLLQKIDASVENQLSLAKLSFGILGKLSDQL